MLAINGLRRSLRRLRERSPVVLPALSAPRARGCSRAYQSKTLGDDQGLTDRQLRGGTDVFLVGGENLFPARRGFVKFPRNRGERVAGLNNVGSSFRFCGAPLFRVCI